MIPSKHIVKIDENSYPVTFPNVGQMMDIESMKYALTGNRYKEMALSTVRSTLYVLDLVDAIATFSVMIPDLIKDLTINNLLDMNPLESKKIVSAHKKYYKEFYKPLLDAALSEEEEELKSNLDDQE